MTFSSIGSAETQSSANVGVGAPISFAVTVPDLAADCIGIVLIAAQSVGATATVSSVTWGGSGMTRAVPVSADLSTRICAIYYLVNPPDNGSKTIAINFSSPGSPVAASIQVTVAWASAGAAVSLDDTSSGSGTTQNPTIVSTQAGTNELVVSASASAANAISATSTTGCTELQQWDSGGNCSISAYSTPSGSGDATHQHNYSQNEAYGIVSASFKEAGATPLTVQDIAHSHALEAPALTQHNILAAQDIAHSHVLEAPALTQHNILAAQDIAHAHALESPTLTAHPPGGTLLVVQDIAHAHGVENVTLTQHNILVLQDAAHSHSLDGALTLTQHYVITVQDIAHAHAVEAPALTQHNVLVLQDALHNHSLENIILTQHNILVVQDIHHDHWLDGAILPSPPATPGEAKGELWITQSLTGRWRIT